MAEAGRSAARRIWAVPQEQIKHAAHDALWLAFPLQQAAFDCCDAQPSDIRPHLRQGHTACWRRRGSMPLLQ